MPALNVQFTEAELTLLRDRAKATGSSLAKLVHDDAVSNTGRAAHQSEVTSAAAEVIRMREGLLKRLADK
jgi:hypothetical protein